MKWFTYHFQRWPIFKTLVLDFRVNPLTNNNKDEIKKIIKNNKIVDYEIIF